MQYVDLLFACSDLSIDVKDQAIQAVNATLGMAELSFDFNSHLLPREYTWYIEDDPACKKRLELAWTPIVDDGLIVKLMVTVRDVTRIRALELEAQEQKRELDIIAELIQRPAESVNSVLNAVNNLLECSRQELNKDDADINLLFRYMHTLKGNVRSFNFGFLSEVAHIAESEYAKLRSVMDPLQRSTAIKLDRDNLLAGLVDVESVLAEYLHVFNHVLGHEGTDSNAVISLPKERLDVCRSSLGEKDRVIVDNFLERMLASALEEILIDIVNALPDIAHTLGKKAPEVIFESNVVYFKSTAKRLLVDVFTHLFRNSLDHGIETASERLKNGKKEVGTIRIKCDTEKDRLYLRVFDDGRGLNIRGLHVKGVELGKWNADENPALKEIANLIFAAGLSTKNEVSDISGRGVGMDAVKAFLNEQGGDIDLELYDESCKAEDFVPFGFRIDLPNTLWLSGSHSSHDR